MYLTHLASCKCREAPITILDQLIYLVNQKKSHNTIIRVCACVWSRASGPITQPSHHPATDHKTNITFDVFCPRMVRWPFCRSFWFDILFVEEKNRTKQQAYILLMFHSTMPQLPLPPPQVFDLSAWSILSICHCLSNTRVLNFFARLKIVSSFQWISNSETIWIDRTEAEKYLSASRQKRTIEIYLYKNLHQ